MNRNLRLLANRDWMEDRVSLAIFRYSERNGKSIRLLAEPLVFSEMEEGVCVSTPSIELSDDAAIELMDSLWRQGIRPTDKSYGSLQSVKDHLSDMRQIAFHKLGIKP